MANFLTLSFTDFKLREVRLRLNASPAMPQLTLKPTHKCVVAYYENLRKFEKLGIKYESAVRSAFQELLETWARRFDWKLVPEYPIQRKGKAVAKVGGALTRAV